MNCCRTNHRARFLAALVLCLGLASLASAEQRYAVKGLVLQLDPAGKTMTVSAAAIPGFMEAMTMPYSVRDAKELDRLKPGTLIDFTLVVEKDTSYAEAIHVHAYQGLEPDPLTARRLKLLNQAVNPSAAKPLAIGDAVPNFILTDQNRRRVSLSKFAGKVVALNFVYTRCALPNFCYRSSNNFGLLQKRFKDRMGRDLVLLTVTFDPAHDQPEVLAEVRGHLESRPADLALPHRLAGRYPPRVRPVRRGLFSGRRPDEPLPAHRVDQQEWEADRKSRRERFHGRAVGRFDRNRAAYVSLKD